MILKNNMPTYLFEFQSNYFMNIHDQEARGNDDYQKILRQFIWESLPFARDIIEPSETAEKPSIKFARFVKDYPQEVISLMVMKLSYLGGKYRTDVIDRIEKDSESEVNKFAQHLLSVLTQSINESFKIMDKQWIQSLANWALYSSNGTQPNI
jgi:hypothetical protein